MIAPGPAPAGLTAAEADRRLAQYGPNDPAPQKQRSQVVDLLLQFANPLVAILLLASIVSAFVGELVNAAIIIVIVSLSVAINFVQTFRSQRAERNTATERRGHVQGRARASSNLPSNLLGPLEHRWSFVLGKRFEQRRELQIAMHHVEQRDDRLLGTSQPRGTLDRPEESLRPIDTDQHPL